MLVVVFCEARGGELRFVCTKREEGSRKDSMEMVLQWNKASISRGNWKGIVGH